MLGAIFLAYGFLNTNTIIVLRYLYACHLKTIHRLADDFLSDVLVVVNLGLATYLSLIEYVRFRSSMGPFLDFCKGIDWSQGASGQPEQGVLHQLFVVTIILNFGLYFRICISECQADYVDRSDSLISVGQSIFVMFIHVGFTTPSSLLPYLFLDDLTPLNKYPMNIIHFICMVMPGLTVNFWVPLVYFVRNKNIRKAMIREAKDLKLQISEKWYFLNE